MTSGAHTLLEKKALRLITFSSYNEHSSPLFKDLNVVKLFDIITFQLAVFMYKQSLTLCI